MLILDRFEGGYALIEFTDDNGDVALIKAERTTISSEVREGDVIICSNGIYMTDSEETTERRKKLTERLKCIKNGIQ